MFEWLKRLLGKRQVEKPRPISIGQQVEKHEQRVRELDNEIEEFRKRQREELARRVRPRTPLEALKEANIRNRGGRQPASQTYTGRKVRGMPPRSARNKRMWKLQVSKEELDEL